MARIYNFSAGPAILPEEVLQEAAAELVHYRETGISVMEMSHRSSDFQKIMSDAEANLRRLANIPDSYEVLFLQGGGSTQFAMVPMNLMPSGKADYIVSGHWAKKAKEEAEKYGDIRVLASSEAENFSRIPDLFNLSVREDADYVYITENNTIYGTRYAQLPDTKGKVLVSDSSSCFLSAPFDITQYGLMFAGAQKNIGPAGVTIVVVRKDLISGHVEETVPTMLRYQTHAQKQSAYNTPPCYAIYMVGKVLQWILDRGGLEEMARRNGEKAALLYDYLDQSRLFQPTARKEDRSPMNVCFVTGDPAKDAAFVAFAAEQGLVNLKGHRSVGGVRASIYNAMPLEGVEKLVACMDQFEKENR